MNKKQKEAMIAMEIKVAGLEEAVRRHKICIDAHNTRLSDHDESIEALDETAVQLSPCKCQAGELLERIVKLEKVKEDVRDLWCSQRAVVDEAIRRDVAVETLQQQAKEYATRLNFFHETTGEINKELQVLQQQMATNNSRLAELTQLYLEMRPPTKRKGFHDIDEPRVLCGNTATAHPPDTPQVNLLTVKKPSRPRKEYKRIMKKGASVG